MNKLSVAKVVYRILVVVGLLAFNLGNAEVALPAQAGTDTVIVRYAVPGGLTNGDCDTWSNACELQTALGMAADGEEVWARRGVYKPTSGTDRTATFQLKDGVAVYGGFAGTETARDQRQTNLYDDTILSGDIDNNDSQTPVVTDIATVTGNDMNSYHVVTGATGATLDGFAITAGYANAAAQPNNLGGGLYNESVSSARFVNLVIRGNYASAAGGGVDNHSSTPTFTNITVVNNEVPVSGYGGGGMFNWNSNSIITNATFSGNRSSNGGGMYNDWSSPTLTNVTFTGNTASSNGGGSIIITPAAPRSATRLCGGTVRKFPILRASPS